MTIKRFWWLGIWLVLYACANQVAPTGGPKDETPPEVVQRIPGNETTQFTAPAIYLEFDEFINFTYPNPEFSITPALPELPEVLVKNKSITIQLPDSLLPETTYLVNFGNSLKDLNENNVLSNFSYVFSTGAYIDSLSLAFEVRQPLTQQPAPDIVVGLYPKTLTDNTLRTEKPIYFQQTNEEGQVNFAYLRADTFSVIGFADKNNDLLIQPATESIAFLVEPVIPSNSPDRKTMLINPPHDFDFVCNAKQEEQGSLTITSSYPLPAEALHLSGVDSFAVLPLHTDSFRVIYQPTTADSIVLQASYSDTMTFTDTLLLRQLPDRDSLFTLPAPLIQYLENGLLFRYPLKTPLQHIDSQSFVLSVNSLPIDYQCIVKSKGIEIRTDGIPFGDTLDWAWPTQHLIDWYGIPNRAASGSVSIPNKEEWGQLVVMVDSAWIGKNIRLQLLTESGQLIRSYSTKGDSWQIPYLSPGNYSVRAIVDRNGNGYWDAGRWALQQLPETVFVISSPITIRANWENNVKISPD